MERRFHIAGSAHERPDARAVLFCDGSADATFREGVDLELSHWIPNRTPARYRADTSTGICMKFAADPGAGAYDLVVNNHVDVDGILSVFTLVRPDVALAHRATVVAAAEMGDFWAWGDADAQTLCQGLTLLMRQLEAEECDAGDVYSRCFARAIELLGGADDEAIAAGRRALAASVEHVTSGRVQRVPAHERFVRYVIPLDLAERDPAAALRVPGFNALLSDATLLLPQARNRQDKERVQLVSVAAARGWYHDLWYPGYSWADTEDVWRAPGLRFADSTNAWFHEHEALADALDVLRGRETAPGAWCAADRVQPFETLPGRDFPVVVSFLSDALEPAPSSLDPADVAAVLAPAFDED